MLKDTTRPLRTARCLYFDVPSPKVLRWNLHPSLSHVQHYLMFPLVVCLYPL